jgi:hypothetical protein
MILLIATVDHYIGTAMGGDKVMDKLGRVLVFEVLLQDNGQASVGYTHESDAT